MSESGRDVSVSRLRDAELETAARLLARAFRDNPLNRAVIRSDDPARRERANRHGMRGLLPVALGHAEVFAARLGVRLVGVLVGLPPGTYPLPPPPLRERLRSVWGQGLGVAARWGEVFAELHARHPAGPHWTLGTLGVEPAHQGQGVGTRLVQHWLEHVAEQEALPGEADGPPDPRGPIYLETDREANLAFYRALGFEPIAEELLLGVRVWCLLRPA